MSKIYSVRPAFKINLSSVIFSSSATGGKPTAVGATLSVATQPTGEQKLTVIDTNTSNLNLVIIPADSAPKTAVQGETIAIPYTGAVAGTDKFVSCVIEDSTGAIKYYAKLTNTANGTASINIPANMPAGNYKIKRFNEQCNLDNYTDFASDPIAIDLTVNTSIAPTAPQNLTANAGDGQVALSWAAPLNNGNSAIIRYEVQKDSDGWITAATNTSHTFSGLTNGQSYSFKVRAVNYIDGAEETVNAIPIAAVAPTATPASLTLQEGTTGTFALTMGTGTNKATSVSIASDNTSVATVGTTALTANGTITVTGVAEGNTNITLAWVGGSLNGTTSTVAVAVSKLPVSTAPTINGTGAGTTSRTVTLGYSALEHFDFTLGGTPAPT